MCHMLRLWRNFLVIVFLIHLCGISTVAESVTMPKRLSPCPDSPNCVSSDATDASHRVEPFEIIFPSDVAWSLAREAVNNLPRTKITQATDNYLRAECTSAVFGFVDDLELELRMDKGVIAVRSAARTGYWDFGVNRRRAESLREALRSRGVVK